EGQSQSSVVVPCFQRQPRHIGQVLLGNDLGQLVVFHRAALVQVVDRVSVGKLRNGTVCTFLMRHLDGCRRFGGMAILGRCPVTVVIFRSQIAINKLAGAEVVKGMSHTGFISLLIADSYRPTSQGRLSQQEVAFPASEEHPSVVAVPSLLTDGRSLSYNASHPVSGAFGTPIAVGESIPGVRSSQPGSIAVHLQQVAT